MLSMPTCKTNSRIIIFDALQLTKTRKICQHNAFAYRASTTQSTPAIFPKTKASEGSPNGVLTCFSTGSLKASSL